MIRWIVTVVFLALLVGACGVFWINEAEMTPEIWHVDPATVERTGRPNDYLVAPPGTTDAAPDREADFFAEPPQDLLERFVAIALAAPKTEEISEGEAGWRTFVQRSRLIGFPDYVTVKPFERNGQSALIIYSRSQYGYSDWGVNKKRVEDWLSKL